MDFTIDNTQMLRKMLEDRFPDQIVMSDWKNEILEKLRDNLRKEDFDDEQLRKIARAVWTSLDI